MLFRYLQGEVAVSDEEVKDVIKRAKAVGQGQTTAKPVVRKTASPRAMEGVAR